MVSLIGEGGTSRIFKALQQPIDRIVALKIPSFAEAGSILSPDEFLAEATLMARLEHSHVVRIYDFGVHDGKAFICMEYVEGWSLAELVEARGPLSPAAVLAIGAQVLEGLADAHAHDVLHLDLSPANVLIAKRGVAKLTDFGMAGKKRRSAEGRIIGTPAFLSPEHVAGLPGTRASDLFAFASLLYYAATAAPLFDPGPGNARVTQALREIGDARVRLPESRLRALPASLAKIARLALQGREAGETASELRAACRASFGEDRPEDVVRRELDLDGDPLGARGEPELPDGEALRDLYLRLRDEGRHREAVALLERAMRRQPDSPLLRELLAQPPSRAKSGAATMEVGGAAAPAPSPRPGPRASRRAAWALGGILAVTLGILAWARAAHSPPAAPTRAGSGSAPGAIAAAPVTALPTPPVLARSGKKRLPDDGPTIPDRPRGIPAAARPRPASARHPIPPAVALSGPAGTKVSVDDTAEWVAPGPQGGWPVSPGLVNITLTPPGKGRPISSSLFVADDTLYVLSLDAEGGFSVTRRRR